MQWNKFKEFLGTHLELAPCFSEQLVPITRKGEIRSMVEQELEYVAVRPWESLELAKTGSYEVHEGRNESSVRYTVYFHIEGHETSCVRARASYSPDQMSVSQIIAHLKEWHLEYWAKQPHRPLVFDAVVRRNARVYYDTFVPTKDTKNLEFFLFPEGFNA